MSVEAPKVIVGKDNFLFLGGADANDIEQYFSGSKTIETNCIRIYERNIKGRKALSIPIHTLVIPEAHVVYREKLPDWFHVSDRRPVTSVLPLYGDNITYPLSDLANAKRSGTEIYTGHDSHWTEHGALIAYRKVRKALGKNGQYHPAYQPESRREMCDLRIKLNANMEAPSQREIQSWTALTAKRVFSTDILNKGLVALFHNPKKEGRLLVFGTSFSVRLVPFYTEDFAEVLFVYGTNLDQKMLDIFRPDCVLMEMPERFLPRGISDDAGYSTTLSAIARATFLDEQKRVAFHYMPDAMRDLSENSRNLVAYFKDMEARIAQSISSTGDSMTSSETDNGLISEDLIQAGLALRQRPGLLPLILGHFKDLPYLYRLFAEVDAGRLPVELLPYLPSSEIGLLVRIRAHIRANDHDLARLALDELARDYGISNESRYYHKYLHGSVQ